MTPSFLRTPAERMPGYQTFQLHDVIPRNFQEVLHYIAGPTSLESQGKNHDGSLEKTSKTEKRSTVVGDLDLLQDTTEVKKPEVAEEDETQQKREEKEVDEEEEEEEALKLEEPLVKLVRYDSSVPNALDNLLPEREGGQSEHSEAIRSRITHEGSESEGKEFLPIQVRRSKFILPPLPGLTDKHVKRITLFAPQDFVFQ